MFTCCARNVRADQMGWQVALSGSNLGTLIQEIRKQEPATTILSTSSTYQYGSSTPYNGSRASRLSENLLQGTNLSLLSIPSVLEASAQDVLDIAQENAAPVILAYTPFQKIGSLEPTAAMRALSEYGMLYKGVEKKTPRTLQWVNRSMVDKTFASLNNQLIGSNVMEIRDQIYRSLDLELRQGSYVEPLIDAAIVVDGTNAKAAAREIIQHGQQIGGTNVGKGKVLKVCQENYCGIAEANLENIRKDIKRMHDKINDAKKAKEVAAVRQQSARNSLHMSSLIAKGHKQKATALAHDNKEAQTTRNEYKEKSTEASKRLAEIKAKYKAECS